MDHVHKCTSVLRPLITAGQTNGIPLAEQAINDMLVVAPKDQHREALNGVRSVVKAHQDAAGSGQQYDFAETVNNYIEKLFRDLV